jgi:hypothetical protein
VAQAGSGQAQAINRGFAGVDCEIMAYLNSDDVLMPGTLAYVSKFFHAHPEVDIVCGHRVFINSDGLEVGRAVLPRHHAKTLMWADYIPQETMFRRRAGLGCRRRNRREVPLRTGLGVYSACSGGGIQICQTSPGSRLFRVHDAQKTAAIYDVGRQEMQRLRSRYLGCEPGQGQIYRAAFHYLARQLAFHWMYKTGILRY